MGHALLSTVDNADSVISLYCRCICYFFLWNELSWSSCSAIWLTDHPPFPCAWLSWVENYHFFGKWPGYHRTSICVTRSVTVLSNLHFIYGDKRSHKHCWSRSFCFRLHSAMTTAGSLHWLWKTLFWARKVSVNSRWPWRYSHSGWRMSTSPSDLARSWWWADRRHTCMRPVNDAYIELMIGSSVRFVIDGTIHHVHSRSWLVELPRKPKHATPLFWRYK